VCAVAVALGVVGLCGRPATASVLFDNLAESTDAATSVGNFYFLAESFSTGSVPFLLRDVQLKLNGIADDDGSGGRSFTVELLSDNNKNPDVVVAPLASFSDNVLSETPTAIDIPLSGNSAIQLAPTTRYWIGIVSDDLSAVSSANWNMSSSTGQSEEFVDIGGGVTSSNDSNLFAMKVEGDSPAVPEPATIIVWSLLGGCGIALGWQRRKRAA
jgi:hypothetical protein